MKAFNQEKYEQDRYAAVLADVLHAGIKRTHIAAFFSSFVSLLLNVTLVLLLFYGVQRVLNGQLSVGDLTAFVLYGVIVAVSFSFVANGYSEFMQALGASERIFDYLDLGDRSPPEKSTANVNLTGDVEFKDISFSYPSRTEVGVLKNVTFALQAGSVTALVGPSGAGKTTVVNLLMKFYEPESGKIIISGTDSKDIGAHALRSKMAFVPQDPQLFAISIKENLLYAKPQADNEELEEACRKANILDFIKALPQQFETEVGERGVQLSAGQKQRISIARAILRSPQLLILDEATSALDSENEYLVQQALTGLMQGRTTLVIAHRLSTVKNAGRVLVLEKGRIVQSGRHESLVQESGLYRQLVERQELVVNA